MGDRDPQRVERDRHDDGWKLPLWIISPCPAPTSGLSLAGLTRSRPPGGGADVLAQRAVDLRGHPERQRVLHRPGGPGLRRSPPRESVALPAAPTPLWPGYGFAARQPAAAASVAAERLQRHGGGDVGRRGQPGGAVGDQRALADRQAVGGQQREAVLGRQRQRGRCRPAPAPRRPAAPPRAPRACPRRSRPGRSWPSGRGRRRRPSRRISITGCTPALSMSRSTSATAGLAPAPPRARPASRANIAARTTSSARDRPDAGRVRSRAGSAWNPTSCVVGQPRVLEVPDAGGQAVDRGAGGEHGVDHRRGWRGSAPARAGPGDRGAVRHPYDVGDGQRRVADRDGSLMRSSRRFATGISASRAPDQVQDARGPRPASGPAAAPRPAGRRGTPVGRGRAGAGPRGQRRAGRTGRRRGSGPVRCGPWRSSCGSGRPRWTARSRCARRGRSGSAPPSSTRMLRSA